MDSILLRSLFVLRSRFAEDRLAAAAARGVRQYVIVGAGLDTFPWRQPDYARGMQIFLADHVASLAWTQVKFWERGLPKPANLTFVPLDLEQERVGETLAVYGFDLGAATFCSVLGVTQYLESDLRSRRCCDLSPRSRTAARLCSPTCRAPKTWKVQTVTSRRRRPHVPGGSASRGRPGSAQTSCTRYWVRPLPRGIAPHPGARAPALFCGAH